MYLIMELKEMLKKLSEAVCDLRLKGSKNNPLITEVNELLVRDNHSKLLNAYNSFYVKDGDTEYASVKYSGVRYIVIKTKNNIGEDIAVYAFDREGLNSNPLIPKYIATNGVSYDIHDCDNECINNIMNYVITFLTKLDDADLSKTNIKPDICDTIHKIISYIVITKIEDFNQFIFDNDESNNIFAADKRFNDALEEANKPEVTKEDVKKLADELADNIILAATKDEPTTCEVVESDVQLKDVFNKELQHVPMPDIESVNDHDNTIIKMTKAVKNKNFKKEFWDDNIIFSLKDKKFNKFLNRLYNVLTKGYKGGVYYLSTNDGGESFSWESIASVNPSNIGLGFIALTYNNDFNINISASKSEKSKYINMDIYQGSSGNHAAVIATIKFNLTNRYFYYNMRQFSLLFEAISAIVHPALVFYYSDPKIMKMYLSTIFFEYGFINYIEKIEEEHQKAEALDKARKDLKKDEKKRKKAEKKAAKKEKKSKKESKEETK